MRQIAVLALALLLAGCATADERRPGAWSFGIIGDTPYTATEEAELELHQISLPKTKEAIEQRIVAWRKTAERYDTEPDTGEGRKELATRAKQAEKKRDYALAGYHHYEVASAAVQIAIVLASAAIITGIAALSWIAAGLGIVGVAFCGIGFFAPTAVHLF